MTGRVYVAGCRDDLRSLGPSDNAVLHSFFLQLATDELEAQKRCDEHPFPESGPHAARLQLARQLGRHVVSDWCWEFTTDI
jgi:hypothetical protein